MTALDSRRDSCPVAAGSAPAAAARRARARKIAGIIVYADPLPRPDRTNSAMNPA